MTIALEKLSKMVPEEVGRLAHDLHTGKSSNQENLSIEYNGLIQNSPLQASGGLWQIHEKRLEFPNLDARNQCVAVHVFRANFPEASRIDTEKLFKLARDLLRNEISSDSKACGRFLALSSSSINVLQAATHQISGSEKNVFDTLRPLGHCLPYLPEIDIADLCHLICAQHHKTKNDLANGILFNAIEDTLLERPEQFAWDIYEYIHTNFNDALGNLAICTLMAITKSGNIEAVISRIEADIKSTPLLAPYLTWTAARLLNEVAMTPSQQITCKSVLCKQSHSTNSSMQLFAIRGICHAATKCPDLLVALQEHANSLDQQILHQVADFLAINTEDIKLDESFHNFMKVLLHLSPGESNNVQSLDMLCATLWENPEFHPAISDFLTNWIKIHGSPKLKDTVAIELFEQTIGKLLNTREQLMTIITEWLVADDVKLAASCGGLISFLWVRNFRNPHFSKTVLDRLDADDLVFLALRMLGFVLWEEPLISLTFSLLDTVEAPSRTYHLVHQLLSQEIGRNFYSKTIKAIDQEVSSNICERNPMLISAQENLNKYFDAIEKLPRLQELRPPFQLRRSIALKRAKEMQKSKDIANEKSVIRQIFTTIPLKAGTGSFSVNAGKLGKVNHLHSFSEEIHLPRLHLNDPVGYAIAGLHFRNIKRGEE